MVMGIAMFSHNKFLSFLIACTVANPCFAGGNIGMRGTGSGSSLVSPDAWQTIPFSGGLSDTDPCNCPKNYYVSRCGDMDLDLITIIALVKGKYNVDPNCWDDNDSYTSMHYLLHLNNNQLTDYTGSATTNSFFSTKTIWKTNDETCGVTGDSNAEIYKLQQIRKDIYDACLSSCTCTKCPNDGVTDSKTNVNTDGDKFFENFNTIADCYTYGGSDGKGTFTVKGNTDDEEHRCYYSYSE